MLKTVLFYITHKLEDSLSFRKLLHSLETAKISYTIFSDDTAFTVPIDNCYDVLMVTNSSDGITFAQRTKRPVIGYAPPKSFEDMSGAYALFEDFASIDANYLCRTHAHALGYPADILTTERLTVREFCEEDFPTLYTMCTEPSTAFCMEEILSDFETEKEKHAAYIRTIYPFFDLALWGVFDQCSGKLIGRAGFSLPDSDYDAFSLGYLIDVPYRRQGYAKELIPALLTYAKNQGYSKISACIKQDNIASLKALEQCGFSYKRRENHAQHTITYLIQLSD